MKPARCTCRPGDKALCDWCAAINRQPIGESWFDQLDHVPCPSCTRTVLALTGLCRHDADPLCERCCHAQHPRRCSPCAGTGQLRADWRLPGVRKSDPTIIPCEACDGTGTVNRKGAA